MNDNVIYMGINAPRIHQATITRLIHGLMSLYVARKTELFAYPETMIDESETSPVPDVMLVNPETDLTEVILEITHTQGVAKDVQKLQNLMETYRVPEGFVYDYKRKAWRKFRLGVGEVTGNPSFCEAVGYDLNEFLKEKTT